MKEQIEQIKLKSIEEIKNSTDLKKSRRIKSKISRIKKVN